MYTEGRLILGGGEHYQRILTLARLGMVPFFVILVFTTWYWARRVADERTAALAVLFVAANPNVLAHAGIAGTDIGPAAMMPAALLAWTMWLEQPSTKRSLILGLLVALCGLTKFNAIAYWFPAAIAVSLFSVFNARRDLRWKGGLKLARPLGLAVLVAALVTWTMYRFSVGKVGGLTLPAPEFFTGLAAFSRHGTGGHPAYLFGRVKLGGWWYYDLIVVLVKTPLPLLLLGAFGIRLALGSRRAESVALLCGIGSVLLVATLTPVDIGVRLLLPMYSLLAVLAAIAFVWAWERARNISTRFAVSALLVWTILEPATTHPDYIAYFNQLAGPEPDRVLVDSNLDWGQDLYRLRDAAKQLRMDSLRVHYFGTAEFSAVGLERARRLRPNERTTGWVAASETFYAGVWADSALHWLHAFQPVARVGRSIRLYYIKP
jgi:4-amino-4-deoxy-L-arabinose transferase-like glycosyltransferase